jgi:putative transposase
MKAITTAPRSPWQNPSCARVSGRRRRDVLAQVSVLKERRLQRVLTAYSADYHRFRPPLSLEMDCPYPRAVEPIEIGPVKARPEVGGLQHPYERQAA